MADDNRKQRKIVSDLSQFRRGQFMGILRPHRTVNFLRTRGQGIADLLAKLKINKEPESSTQQMLDEITLGTDDEITAMNFRENFVLVGLIGQGGNGQVDLHKNTTNGNYVAVKTLRSSKSNFLPEEVRVLSKIGRHENVVKMHGVFRHPETQQLHIAFEYCQMGDLHGYFWRARLRSHSDQELFLWHMLSEITAGLQFLHTRGVIHGDIKAGNILLGQPRYGAGFPVMKVCDFGSASVNPHPLIPQGQLGTLGYQPPETLFHYGPGCDIWAVGCLVHEFATKCLPAKVKEAPQIDPVIWFDTNRRQVPPYIKNVSQFKRLAFFMEFHPAHVARIDRPTQFSTALFSKLLNYVMMRALEQHYLLRISAAELHKMLPILEPLVRRMSSEARYDFGAVIEEFDDGRDHLWRKVANVKESEIFRQIHRNLINWIRQEDRFDRLHWARDLIQLMDASDQAYAKDFVDLTLRAAGR